MRLELPQSLLILLAAAAIGLFAGLAIDDEADEQTPPQEPAKTVSGGAPTPAIIEPSDAMQAARIDALERQLAAEIKTRRALERRLDEMEQLVTSLDGESAQLQLPDPAESDEAAGLPAASAWFDEAALLESGMDSGLANELKVFFEQLELERLNLRDRAAREGWERGRLGEELGLLNEREQALKDRLGEDAYDAYLYASGQPNRVAVTSVLDSAQAAQAGIQPGDLIIRYDNERIYNWRGLRTATTSGDLGDTVEIEVERDGDSLQFYLTRGPLGIRMDSRSVAP